MLYFYQYAMATIYNIWIFPKHADIYVTAVGIATLDYSAILCVIVDHA